MFENFQITKVIKYTYSIQTVKRPLNKLDRQKDTTTMYIYTYLQIYLLKCSLCHDTKCFNRNIYI